jgi:hypothetical protein
MHFEEKKFEAPLSRFKPAVFGTVFIAYIL